MNIIDAAHATVRNYPGGSESLGPRIGMSPAVLRNKVNPNNSTHHLTLAEADAIMGVAGDYQVLQALAASHGFVLQSMESATCDGNILQAVLKANAADGALDSVLQDALADGEVTPNEARTVQDAASRVQSALVMLVGKVRALSERRAQP